MTRDDETSSRGPLFPSQADRIARYWHTLRHMRPVQIYGRVWFHLARPRLDGRRAPARRAVCADAWAQPARRAPSVVGPTRLRFLGVAHDLQEHGWDDPALERLWRYNLHYFDDLNAFDAADRAAWHVELARRWVRENAPGSGTGWEPYPTSLRIVNWIKWALAGATLPGECVQSLAEQVRWLTQRLEVHLLGNHLFANAKALVFAGLFFEGREAERWLERGLEIVAREVPEQILPDGGHFERSTMYHALALEDALDLCNVTRAFPDAVPAPWRSRVSAWSERVGPMLQWLSAMCHPDGEIAHFNDAGIGIAPAPAELVRYASSLGFSLPPPPAEGVTDLRSSGYVRLQCAPAAAILDVAPVGPDYLPAHGHADTLSFELSISGQRLVVNSGTSCYGSGPERLRQRGTGAHSTVQVDGADSSEVWSGFRVARRARAFGLKVGGDADGGCWRVSCSHDGYTRLPSSSLHTRDWTLLPGELRVVDSVTGAFREAVARFFFHPHVVVLKSTEQKLELRGPSGLEAQVSWDPGLGRIVAATWHPGFGTSEPNRCLEIRLDGSRLETTFTWHGRARVIAP